MMLEKKLSLSLLILRLTIAAFFGVWSSLKFFRPEWFQNVFQDFYKISFVTSDSSMIVGVIQMLIVLAFVLGYKRTISYGILVLMQGAGVLGSIPNLMNFTEYPNNLFWAAVPALGAAIVLFILRHEDRYTIDGRRDARHVASVS